MYKRLLKKRKEKKNHMSIDVPIYFPCFHTTNTYYMLVGKKNSIYHTGRRRYSRSCS